MKAYFGSIQELSFEISKLINHKNIYMVFDQNTLEYLNTFESVITQNIKYLIIPSGEENKTLDNVTKIWDFLNLNHAKSGDYLLIVGGGMTGDLAGFAASTFKRGIKFILFPSTLLSMVDSSIGGKTGFNYNFIKNNIGTLSYPEAVFYDVNFLNTLPKNHIISGLSGIGPFVVGPAVERKIGLSAMSALAINAHKWFDANWALQKGLYAEIFENSNDMDLAIKQLTNDLSCYSLEAMKKLKKTFWEGTDHWDNLLNKRAEISGSLIITEFSKETIQKIQNK